MMASPIFNGSLNLNIYLINNVEDIVAFLDLKVFL